MQDSHPSVAQWLMEKCQNEGLSLRQAASKTGLSHATIADITNGGRPSPQTVITLAKAFGGDGHLNLALEDKLLGLAGYRTPRPGEEPSEVLAQLLDKLTGLSPQKMGMVEHFIDYINGLEEK